MMTKSLVFSISATALLISATLPATAIADTRGDPPAKHMTLKPAVGPLGLKARGAGPSRANDPKDLPCPADRIAVIYDEDANGNPVPGTENYFCVWD